MSFFLERAFFNVNGGEKYLLVNNGIIKNISLDARHIVFCGCIYNLNFLLNYAVPEIRFILYRINLSPGKLQSIANNRNQETYML